MCQSGRTTSDPVTFDSVRWAHVEDGVSPGKLTFNFLGHFRGNIFTFCTSFLKRWYLKCGYKVTMLVVHNVQNFKSLHTEMSYKYLNLSVKSLKWSVQG